jgi:hypothetical protein
MNRFSVPASALLALAPVERLIADDRTALMQVRVCFAKGFVETTNGHFLIRRSFAPDPSDSARVDECIPFDLLPTRKEATQFGFDAPVFYKHVRVEPDATPYLEMSFGNTTRRTPLEDVLPFPDTEGVLPPAQRTPRVELRLNATYLATIAEALGHSKKIARGLKLTIPAASGCLHMVTEDSTGFVLPDVRTFYKEPVILECESDKGFAVLMPMAGERDEPIPAQPTDSATLDALSETLRRFPNATPADIVAYVGRLLETSGRKV